MNAYSSDGSVQTQPLGGCAACTSVEEVVTTAELATRPSRAPDYRAESEALVALSRHLADSPKTILQKLVDTALVLCEAQSAGISIEENCEGKDIFRWHATAGELAPFTGGTMPRNFSPCGMTVDSRKTQMMRDPVRFYPYIAGLNIPVHEVLLVPFTFGGKVVGTVWIVCDGSSRRFDAEDGRVVSSLAQFASTATETLATLEAAEKAKLELKEVGAKLESALNAGAIATWSWDIIHDRVFVDAQFSRLFLPPKMVVNGSPIATFFSRVHHEDRPRAKLLLAQAVESGGIYESEHRVKHPDGSYHWVMARGQTLLDADGRAVQFPGVILDVTERKLAQLDKERQQHALWAALPVACYALDVEGRVTFFNEAARKLWGRAPKLGVEKWGGAHALATLDGQPLTHERSPIVNALKGRRSVCEDELFIVRADGSRRRVIPHIDPVLDPTGTFIGVVNVMFDVTEERLARAALLEARDQAVAASRAKDDFIAALSHELRTPLNPVLLLASDAAGNTDYPAEAREDFERVRKNIELEAKLIDDLLDVTRISRGLMKLETSVTDLYGIVREAGLKVKPDAQDKSVTLQWCLPGEAVFVNGDAVRLQQVFWNVLKNAVKFTPHGGRIDIQAVPASHAGSVAVRIQDSGIGMVPAELDTIFSAFVQGDHAGKGGAHQFGGLGLGLAISQKIMELHHGTITATSDGRGKGSAFVVEMPLAVPAMTVAPAENAFRNPVSATPLSGLSILIVEDNTGTRETLQRLLVRRGYQVAAADSGHAARELVAAQIFDLAICDVGLPDTDGHTLLAELHRLRPGLAAIAMTGYGTEKDMAQSNQAGFLLHLTKPVTVAHLEQAIAQIAPAFQAR